MGYLQQQPLNEIIDFCIEQNIINHQAAEKLQMRIWQAVVACGVANFARFDAKRSTHNKNVFQITGYDTKKQKILAMYCRTTPEGNIRFARCIIKEKILTAST